MQGRGSGTDVCNPLNWREEVKLKIHNEAQVVYERTPPYFRRFDAFDNEEYPSIFKRRHKTNNVATAAAAATAVHQIPGSSNPASSTLNKPQLGSAGGAANGAGAPRVAVSGKEPSPTQLPATDRDAVVVAIGPYHYRSTRAPPLVTRAKKCGVVMFLSGPRFRLDTGDFLGWARENEARARRCYEWDSIELRPEELAEMLLLDGCLLLFTVFLLRTNVWEDGGPSKLAHDETQGKEFIYLSADISLHMKQTRLDLLMLDNQIPFFVLQELHNRLKGTLFGNIDHGIHELVLSCFEGIHPGCLSCEGGGNAAAAIGQCFPSTVHHLLHLFHLSRVPRDKYKVGISSVMPKEPEPHLPSATELEESLTRFKHTNGDSYSLDIEFQSDVLSMRGVMSIPALCIHSYSECVFRSLIEFEQRHLRCGLGVTAYCICMAQLLQSEADAKVLRKKGILVHSQKTDKEIVDFFRGLKDEYGDTLMPDDLLQLCKDVVAHRQSRAGRMVKWIGRQCFPRQTVTFFVIFGAIISVATLVNTIHSMYRYYHPFKGSGSFYYPPNASP